MKIEFNSRKMRLSSFNPRAEMHGEEREPAADIKFTVDLDNDVLGAFHPALKSALYYFDESRKADLVDQAKKDTEGYAPHLRFPSLEMPIKWAGEMPIAKLTLAIPGKHGITLEPVKVNAFTIDAKEGGTVALAFRVQGHPDEKQAGKLAMLVQQDVELTLHELEPQQSEIASA